MDLLVSKMQTKGEKMSEKEVKDCLEALIGPQFEQKLAGTSVNAKEFAENILGFEDYDELTAA